MSNLYIPPGSLSLKNQFEPQIRLGLQGAPKTGKTFAATTFPNPIFLNLDRGLGAHAGREDIHEVPFWDDKFVDSIYKRAANCPPNVRDALEKWLNTEAVKLQENQTLILDGSTGIQNAFDRQESLEPVITKSGKVDDFAFWRHKVEYFGRIIESLKRLKCHVIYICHETPDRNKEGELNGKLRPMLTGQFGDQLASHFTDWFRQHAIDKPESPEKYLKVKLDQYGVKTIDEFKQLISMFSSSTGYWWQTESDDLFNGGSSSLDNPPRFIPAHYSSFAKYRKKRISA